MSVCILHGMVMDSMAKERQVLDIAALIRPRDGLGAIRWTCPIGYARLQNLVALPDRIEIR